jgi:hypothetical protein
MMIPNDLRTLRWAALLSPALLLTACGGGTKSEEGASDNAAGRAVAGAAASAVVGGLTGMGVSTGKLPDFVELPPGAKAINNMAINDAGKTGGSLSLEVTQKPEELVTFYRDSMARHGLKIGMENQSAQLIQMIGASEDKAKSLMVMVNIDDQGKAMLNLVHSLETK